MRVRFRLHGIKFSALSIYAPQNATGEGEASKDRFYAALKKALSEERSDRPGHRLLIAGDFNATIGRQSAVTKHVGRNHDKYDTTDNGERLCDFANAEGMYVVNTKFTARHCHSKTWTSADKKTEKRLDYFLADSWLWRCSIN